MNQFTEEEKQSQEPKQRKIGIYFFFFSIGIAVLIGAGFTYFWSEPLDNNFLIVPLIMGMSILDERGGKFWSGFLEAALTCIAVIYACSLSCCCVLLLFPDKTPVDVNIAIPDLSFGLWVGLLFGFVFSGIHWLMRAFVNRPEKKHPLVAAMEKRPD